MRRIAALLLVGIVCLTSASTLRAQQPQDDGFWANCHRDYLRNKQWPHPFVECDRVAVRAPFCVMVANGWQRQNLIGEQYFDETSKRLTLAGSNRIRDILLETQPQHRVIFVQRDLSSAVTAGRMAAVQDAIAVMAPDQPMPDVLVSNMRPEGRSAEIVNLEQRAYAKSVPNPRLTAAGGGGGGSSGSGGSGGAPGGSGGGS